MFNFIQLMILIVIFCNVVDSKKNAKKYNNEEIVADSLDEAKEKIRNMQNNNQNKGNVQHTMDAKKQRLRLESDRETFNKKVTRLLLSSMSKVHVLPKVPVIS